MSEIWGLLTGIAHADEASLAWFALLLGVAYIAVNVALDVLSRVIENRCKHAWANKLWCGKCWAQSECRKYKEKGRF